MLTKIQKWGNSFAVRIPKAFASDVRIEKDSVIEIFIIDNQIVIKPVNAKKYSLKQLLSDVNVNNIHSEIHTGTICGNEIW
ncbi:MAG: AbrB/MazE/SpoVT family DNA-binding domain-containing protein [Deltaproteobacteria bacterium]|jgi:antitoxin MazE|nr:AbrB/MazE/SpoVT family DNA-binding domain-containing protein [Deltaproteobacteria bacterium]